jgi:hypothetical protein
MEAEAPVNSSEPEAGQGADPPEFLELLGGQFAERQGQVITHVENHGFYAAEAAGVGQ